MDNFVLIMFAAGFVGTALPAVLLMGIAYEALYSIVRNFRSALIWLLVQVCAVIDLFIGD